MPDANGLLTEDEKQKVIAALKGHGPAAICPVCKSNQWVIAPHLVQPITLGPGGGLQLGGESYPQVMLISAPCGYTMFLNAVRLGVAPPSDPKVEPKK